MGWYFFFFFWWLEAIDFCEFCSLPVTLSLLINLFLTSFYKGCEGAGLHRYTLSSFSFSGKWRFVKLLGWGWHIGGAGVDFSPFPSCPCGRHPAEWLLLANCCQKWLVQALGKIREFPQTVCNLDGAPRVDGSSPWAQLALVSVLRVVPRFSLSGSGEPLATPP